MQADDHDVCWGEDNQTFGIISYLTEEFYKTVHHELVKYAGDYELLQQRTRIMEAAHQEKVTRDELEAHLFETFKSSKVFRNIEIL